MAEPVQSYNVLNIQLESSNELLKKENELLKKENELLKKKIKLYTQSNKNIISDTQSNDNIISDTTIGWVIFKHASAWDCIPGKFGHNQEKVLNQQCGPKSDALRQIQTIKRGLYGYIRRCNSPQAWYRDMAINSDDLINHITHLTTNDVYIAPGASFKLIYQQQQNGFKIRFENPNDIWMANILGIETV